MAERRTNEDYRAVGRDRGIAWAGSQLPINANTKTLWRCGQGHTWETTYGSIYSGTGCPHCSGNFPLSASDYHRLAMDRGFTWAGSDLPKNAGSKTLWCCAQGHTWEMACSQVRIGQGCPHCAGNFPLQERDYVAAAEAIEAKWVGEDLPTNTKTKTLWRCGQGHTWETTYGSIKRGRGCPHCYEARRGDLLRLQESDYIAAAEAIGVEWVGNDLPTNTKTKTLWRCAKGHSWKTSYGHIQGGKGCPHCSGNFPLSANDYHELAANRGLAWVGETLPRNNRSNTEWVCGEGHRWRAAYNNIKRGTGCPHCVDMVNSQNVSKLQRQIHDLVGGELNFPVGRWRIDVALVDEHIAIEYDSWYWHAVRQQQDEKRDERLQKLGWRVIRIRSGEMLPTAHALARALAEVRGGQLAVEITLSDWGAGNIRKSGGQR